MKLKMSRREFVRLAAAGAAASTAAAAAEAVTIRVEGDTAA